MHVHRARAAVVIPAPHPLQDQVARQRHPPVADQEGQQVVFLGLEVDRLAVTRHFAPRQINVQVAGGQRLVVLRLWFLRRHLFAIQPYAPQLGLDPRQQLAHAERLGHIVVGTHFEAHYLVDLFRACGEHEDRHVHLLADDAADLEPIQAGQHDVEHDQVRRQLARCFQPGHAVHSRVDLVLLPAQIVLQRLQQRRVILNHQDPFHTLPGYPSRL